jgi:signal transduction histidine kinase/CheY-like chemotaxis protein
LFRAASYDTEAEACFQRELIAKVFFPLRVTLLLGALSFMCFSLLDCYVLGLSWADAGGRVFTIASLLGLWGYLRLRPECAKQRLRGLAILGALVSSWGLLAILALADSPAVYADTWPSVLPIYFFTYGQLAVPAAIACLFGLGLMLFMPTVGFLIGVPVNALLPSIMFLMIANLFGVFTRRQLEGFARACFHEKRRAESVIQEKTLFLRQSGHNLRQPLQAVNSYSTVLEQALAGGDMAAAGLLVGKLTASIDSFSNAFNRIMDISNLDAGRQALELAPVALNAVLESLENQFSPLAAQKGLRLKVALRACPPFALQTDENILCQVLCNLLDNAVKYTPKGWILVRALKIRGGFLRIEVRDTGVGIPEAHRADIFKEFFRCNRRQNDMQAKGLGIGLCYVARAVSKLEGHRLSFTSRPGRGTRFCLDIPASQKKPPCCFLPHHSSAPQALHGQYVFLVDNDEAVREALSQQLSCWGCLVEKISSLAELLQALQDNMRPPDLVITEFRLDNGETAFDILSCIAKDCGAKPALVITGQALSCLEKEALGTAAILLRKPVSEASLLHSMQLALFGGLAADAPGNAALAQRLPTSGAPSTTPSLNTFTISSARLETPNLPKIGRM